MKTITNKLIRCERGHALPIVLVLLLLSSLVITPLLNYAGTGIIGAEVHEGLAMEYYAADSGVEDAIWQIDTGNTSVPEVGDAPWEYSISSLNGCSINVTMTYINDHTYKIESIASDGSAPDTKVTAYVQPCSMGYLLGNAITSGGDVELGSSVTVEGDVQYNGQLINNGIINGEIRNEPLGFWPTKTQMSEFYLKDVEGADHYTDLSIQLDGSHTQENPYVLGPIRVDNELEIKGSGYAILEGTVYAGGLISIKPGVNIMLNLNTIYCNGTLILYPGCNLEGTGAVASASDLSFQPGVNSVPYLFLMSVEGFVNLQPNGTFCGSAAGYTGVEAQPGCEFVWSQYFGELNIPGKGKYVNILTRTWETSRQ